jgi:transcription elongation GreA/GreB family factor
MQITAGQRASTGRRRKSGRGASTAVVDLKDLRVRIDETLNRVGAQLIGQVSVSRGGQPGPSRDPALQELQARVALLGQLAAGLAAIDADSLPPAGAGFGSRVTVSNLDTGEADEYVLMVGSLVDIDANQVSLASPIGRALLGRAAGDEVVVDAPNKRGRLLVTNVVTLMDMLEGDGVPAAG